MKTTRNIIVKNQLKNYKMYKHLLKYFIVIKKKEKKNFIHNINSINTLHIKKNIKSFDNFNNTIGILINSKNINFTKFLMKTKQKCCLV
uniref:Uncharacterized protein n=1 Tax=Lotharella vacuolata TaxID=74820 RepID=A0A0H5BQU7_9EUKA|nr:hypothetical protein [Lotharella vacuolata]